MRFDYLKSFRFYCMAAVIGCATGVAPTVAIAVQSDNLTESPAARSDHDKSATRAKSTRRFGSLDFAIDEQMFNALCDCIRLDAGQRHQAGAIHATYLADALEFGNQLQQEILDAGFREYGEIFQRAREEHKASKEYQDTRQPMPHDKYPWEELQTIFVRYTEVQIRGLKKSDARVEQFYGDLEPLLTDDQLPRMPEVRRLMRRLNYFERSFDELTGIAAPLSRQNYVLPRVEPHRLLTLASEAVTNVTVLWTELELEQSDESVEEKLRAAREELETLLESYRVSVDLFLVERQSDRRRMPVFKEGENIGNYSAGTKDTRERWNRLFPIVDGCNRQIAELLGRTFEEKTSKDWLSQYEKSFCPSLTAPRAPDLFVQWISTRRDALPEHVFAIERVVAEYRAKHDFMTTRTIAAGVQLLGATGTTRYDDLKAKYNRGIDDVHKLIASTIRSATTSLTKEQAVEFNKYIDDQIASDDSLLGPSGM